MKYFYTTLFLLCSISLSAQNLYWVGGTTGNWNNPNSWSTTSGGAPGAGVPTSSNYAVFNSNADVTMDLTPVTLQGLHVLNGGTVKLIANAATTLRVTSTSATIANSGLYIAANSSLIDSTIVPLNTFTLDIASNVKGVIEGTLALTGIPGDGTALTFGRSRIQFASNANLEFRNNSVYRQGNAAATTGLNTSTIGAITFLDGSTHMINATSGGNIGPATYSNNSNIYIYGTPLSQTPTFSTHQSNVGNVIVDFQGMAPGLNNKALVFNNNMNVNGNITFKNTGGEELLLTIPTSSTSNINFNKNLIIEPNASIVLGSHNDNIASFQVGGNLVMTGGFLYFRKTPDNPTTYTQPVTLKVLGNISQTGGSITTGNVTVGSPSDELFVIEMAGTTVQTINAAGNWDNDLQNIVLRINNANGVNLNSHLSVSKLSWNSANQGNINTTAANPLTILNPSTTDATVINNVSNSGYVNGPVRRITNSAASYIFPTGNNGVYRPINILPETVTTSTYEAQYFNQAFANMNTSPLMNGISNQEYWRASRVTGSTPASIQLTFNSAIPGTNSNDGLVVSSFNGTQWVSEYTGVVSSMIIPGNSPAGTVQTEYINPNRFYTFGFGTATTLPIHLVGFNVKKVNNNQASVTWEVSAESTPETFVVERSTNGVQFTNVGTVHATTATQYQFEDINLPNGKLYYRLKMFDQDGSVIYTDIISILISNNDSKMQIFPTVTQSQTQLKLELARSTKVSVLVNDNSGRTIQRNAHTLNAGTQYISVNAANLSNGIYYVVILFEDGTSSAPLRFIKQ